MNAMNEWSCSEWIASDDLFLRIGHYWYPLHLDRLTDCIREAVEATAKALRKVVDCIMQNLMDCLPNICIARAEDDAEQYEMQLRARWKPVRYIRAADRRTDRRPPVHHIRSALPNRHKECAGKEHEHD